MIILTVKTNDAKFAKSSAGDYAKAWFRLQNEDTNQTLDYQYVDKVKELEGLEEEEEGDNGDDNEEENEDDEQKQKVEHTIVCGRIFNINMNPPLKNNESKKSLDAKNTDSRNSLSV